VPSWSQRLAELAAWQASNGDDISGWLRPTLTAALDDIGRLRGDRNVIAYFSSFLQKPQAADVSLTHEDLNGLMAVIYGMDSTKPLTLVLHTPGGVTVAAETFVAYLRSKFQDVEVIIPALAMSAGTMISLASNRIVMGRQSQLGPIDPQMPMPATGRFVSARAITEQFEEAQKAITADKDTAIAWAPILQSMGPALLSEARNALEYGEDMVAGWLQRYMFAGVRGAKSKARKAAHHFNDASLHKQHGRRIDRDEARAQGLLVEDLEDNQTLQEAVLDAYHLMTIAVQNSGVIKLLWNQNGEVWLKQVL
jgi:hypothetical protein